MKSARYVTVGVHLMTDFAIRKQSGKPFKWLVAFPFARYPRGFEGGGRVLVTGRYRVESDNADDVVAESSTFKTMERAKALALHRLAYGYECRVVDLATGHKVFPREEDDLCTA